MIRRGRSRSIGVPRRLVDDPALSFRAVGVAVYILGKPDNWRVDGRALARTHTEGRDAVFTALKELEDAGYLVRRRYQDAATGKWWTESVLYETLEDAAADVAQPPAPNPDNQDPVNQDPENRDSVNQDSSLSPLRETQERNPKPAHPRTLFRPDPAQRPPGDKVAGDIEQARAELARARRPDPQEAAAS